MHSENYGLVSRCVSFESHHDVFVGNSFLCCFQDVLFRLAVWPFGFMVWLGACRRFMVLDYRTPSTGTVSAVRRAMSTYVDGYAHQAYVFQNF